MDLLAKKFAIEDAAALESIKSGVGGYEPFEVLVLSTGQSGLRGTSEKAPSMDVIRAVVKGAIIRKFWPLYSSILENVNTEE